MSGHPPASQSAQPISMPSLSGPQPHPKLLEAKQQGAQAIPAVKQEPQLDQNAGGAQRVAVQANAQGQDGQSGQVVHFLLHMAGSTCLCGICHFFITVTYYLPYSALSSLLLCASFICNGARVSAFCNKVACIRWATKILVNHN